MWFSSTVSGSSPSWVQLPGRVAFFSTDGNRALVSLSSGIVYLCTTPSASCSWSQKPGVTAIQVAISGTNVVALERDTNAIKFTSSITVSSPAWSTITNPSATVLSQVSISGTTLVGVAIDGNLYRCTSAPSCAWQSIAPPSNELATFASVSGDYITLMVASGKVFYSTDGSSWTENSSAPTVYLGGVSSFTNTVFPSNYYSV